jgi:PAS domain S-box-containing protein
LVWPSAKAVRHLSLLAFFRETVAQRDDYFLRWIPMRKKSGSLPDEIPVERRFQLLVESVHDYAIYLLTPDGFIQSWNTGAQRFKGYTADEIVGQHFSRFYTPEDRERGEPARALHVALTEGKYENEGWRVRKDGVRFWASVVIDPVHDPSGRLIGFAKVTRDITEKKATEQALEQARAALLQSQKLEAVGKLTGGIAHDFNNLLQVIVNSLSIVSRQIDDPRLLKVLDSAERAAGRGALLTQQLLAFARKQPLKPESYDVNTLIRSIEGILRRASQEMVELDVALQPGVSQVLLDAPQFEAALLNLVVNARDAMPNGGRILVATTGVVLEGAGEAPHIKPGAYVKVTVSDTGTGMPPEVVQQAVEPFFTTKETGKGSGLGLSHVYGFVKQSGGDLVIESKVGEGTTISLYLPATVQAATGKTAETRVEPKRDKVLIVEDEPEVLEITVELFRGMDYEIITAGNGMKAIDVLKRNRDIDILFTDVVMPGGMSGIDLARFTQKLCPGVKVVLASGYSAPALAAQHGKLDDFAFIHKPYRWSELVETLRSVTAST